MNSPFKMKPGRGNMPKTGRGVPPTLMSCSPMKQEPEVEYTKKQTTAVDKFNKAIKTAEGKANIEKGNQIKIDPRSGMASANTATHTTKKVGEFMEEYDSKGGFVKRVQMNKPSEVEKLVKGVERTNKIKGAQSQANVSFTNLGSGRTKPKTDKELQSMRDRGRISKM